MRGLVALRVAARIPQRTEAVVMVAGAGYQACDLLRGRYLPRYLVMPATRDSSHRHRARERHLARAGLAAAPDCQECPAALACDGPDAHRQVDSPRDEKPSSDRDRDEVVAGRPGEVLDHLPIGGTRQLYRAHDVAIEGAARGLRAGPGTARAISARGAAARRGESSAHCRNFFRSRFSTMASTMRSRRAASRHRTPTVAGFEPAG